VLTPYKRQQKDRAMTTYLLHYAAKAPFVGFSGYDPRISPGYLRPPCKIRGRKDVTSDWDRVTCTACLRRKPAAPAEESDQEQDETAETAGRAEQAERYAPTEEAIASAIHYASGAGDYLGAHPYAALAYLRSARELLEKAEALLIEAANH
jgi:hypothetical protein